MKKSLILAVAAILFAGVAQAKIDLVSAAQQAQNKIDTTNKKRILVEAENTKLLAEIEYLKAKIKELENNNDL